MGLAHAERTYTRRAAMEAAEWPPYHVTHCAQRDHEVERVRVRLMQRANAPTRPPEQPPALTCCKQPRGATVQRKHWLLPVEREQLLALAISAPLLQGAIGCARVR